MKNNTFHDKEFNKFLKGEYSLEFFSTLVYQYIGNIPFSISFSQYPNTQKYLQDLKSIITDSNNYDMTRGAFILFTEYHEQNEYIDETFGYVLLKQWLKSNLKDMWILSYIMNRFPQERDRMLQQIENVLENDSLLENIKQKWWRENTKLIIEIFQSIINGYEQYNIGMIDIFMPDDLYDTSLSDINRQCVNLIKQENGKINTHFKDILKQYLEKEDLKTTTRLLLVQMILSKQISQYISNQEMIHILSKAADYTTAPFDAFIFSKAEEYKSDKYQVAKEYFNNLNSVAARSNETVFDGIEQIEPETLDEIVKNYYKRGSKLKNIKNDNENIKVITKEILRKHYITFPIDLQDLCKKMNIQTLTIKLPESIEGFTIKNRRTNRGLIVINKNIDSQKRKNFTLAHELGHYILHEFPNNDHILTDDKSNLDLGPIGQNVNVERSKYTSEWEKEANSFAKYLLLSDEFTEIKNLKTMEPPFIPKINKLSLDWNISMSVLVSRTIELTEVPAVLALSKNGSIVFSNASPGWEYKKPDLWKKDLPDHSSSYDLIHSNDFQIKCSKQISPKIWLEEPIDENMNMYEESFSTGYSSVYTIIYLKPQ